MNRVFNGQIKLQVQTVMTGFPGTALPTGPGVLFFGAGKVTACAISPVNPQPVISSSSPQCDGTDRAGRNLVALV